MRRGRVAGKERAALSTGRRAVVLALAGAGLVACGPSGDAPTVPQTNRPNVLLFIIDTLRADALGAYGQPLMTSPELDELAARGVLFRNVIAPSSWTRPSAGAMLTGRYPRSLGIYVEHAGILDDRFVTLAEALRENGYATFGITANPHLNASYNFHQGFDEYVDSTVVYGFMTGREQEEIYKDTKIARSAEMFAHITDFVRRSHDQPVFVQIDLMEVHEWDRGERDLTRDEFDELFAEAPAAKYYQAVRQTSQDLAAYVEQLRALPSWEDALFVFASEHGEGLEDHPDVWMSRYHGRLIYESQVRVPFFLYRDGWTLSGREVDRPVRILDLMPTVLEAVGADVPGGLDGVSLMPLVLDRFAAVGLPEYFVAETRIRGHDKSAVYGRHWSYIRHRDEHPGTAPQELQRLGQPANGRLTNRHEEHTATLARMQEYLRGWERDHRPARTVRNKRAISAEEIEQLKALGYLQ